MQHEDIRWQQRFENYAQALAELETFFEEDIELNRKEAQGLIKCFEYTFEIGWLLMRDYLLAHGATAIIAGSRDAIREAYRMGITKTGDGWMDMLKSRNKTVHTYNQKIAQDVVKAIQGSYLSYFKELYDYFKPLSS